MATTPLLAYGATTSQGSSATAQFVEDQLEDGRRHLGSSFSLGLRAKGVFEAIASVYEECQKPNWDGYGALGVEYNTYRFAHGFLESLPPGTPPPTPGVEADGHLTLEWYRDKHRLLSISISPDGMIYYASLMGYSRRSGTEPFLGTVPEEIMRIIYRLYSNERT